MKCKFCIKEAQFAKIALISFISGLMVAIKVLLT